MKLMKHTDFLHKAHYTASVLRTLDGPSALCLGDILNSEITPKTQKCKEREAQEIAKTTLYQYGS